MAAQVANAHFERHAIAADPAWKEVDSLLKLSDEKYHVYFKAIERVLLHNHLSHHALTLYSLGASKEVIEEQFHNQTAYQQELPALDEQVANSLSEPASFNKYLADPDQYGNYLHFFQQEMQKEGYEKTMVRYCFADNVEADEVFSRLFLGFIHPLIQLGFGVEFNLSYLSCEALAMSCTQFDEDALPLLIRAEEMAKTRQDRLSLVEITDLCSADQILLDSAVFENLNFFSVKGLVGSHPDRILEYASRYTVNEDEIALRSAELCNASSYIMAAAQRLNKEPRMDFFLLHLTNCTILTDAIIHKDWISSKAKAKLLSWFGRFAIMLYIVVRSPKLDLAHIRNYRSQKGDGTWDDTVKRAIAFKDDGHGCKIIRALIHAEKVTKPYQGRPEFRMRGTDFKQAGLAAVDSFLSDDVISRAGYDQVEAWIRLAGFDQPWEKVPNL
ncbi:hypothetical protein N7490_001863 [Penicillium lividum]|nr:hypothetical protein N7490_001863 [Penicillium lividum]